MLWKLILGKIKLKEKVKRDKFEDACERKAHLKRNSVSRTVSIVLCLVFVLAYLLFLVLGSAEFRDRETVMRAQPAPTREILSYRLVQFIKTPLLPSVWSIWTTSSIKIDISLPSSLTEQKKKGERKRFQFLIGSEEWLADGQIAEDISTRLEKAIEQVATLKRKTTICCGRQSTLTCLTISINPSTFPQVPKKETILTNNIYIIVHTNLHVLALIMLSQNELEFVLPRFWHQMCNKKLEHEMLSKKKSLDDWQPPPLDSHPEDLATCCAIDPDQVQIQG